MGCKLLLINRCKQKIFIFLLISVTLLFSGIYGYYIFNYDFIMNKQNGRDQIILSPQNIIYHNWYEDENNQLLSLEDPMIEITDCDCYVSQIMLVGSFDSFDIQPKIYYINKKGEAYSEEKSVQCQSRQVNNDLIISVDQNAYSIRLDLTEDAGYRMQLQNIIVNPCEPVYSMQILWPTMKLFVPLFILEMILWAFFNEFKGKLYGFWCTFIRFRYLLLNLVTRDIKVKYRRSVLGIAWSVLNPLLMMVVITAVFNNLFRFDIEYFPIYYLTGWLIFNFVVEATSEAMNSVIYAGSLIKKVHLPKYIFPLEKCIFALINFLFSLIAMILVMAILRFPVKWTIILFPIPVMFTLIFAIGLGLILASLNVFFRDIGHLYGVWTTAWFYLTPIIYPSNILPPSVLVFVRVNPLYYYVEYFREIVMYGNIPSMWITFLCIGWSIAVLLLGLMLFKRNQDRFILFI